MIKKLQYTCGKHDPLQRAFLLAAVLLLITAFCCPALAARDVKVAIT